MGRFRSIEEVHLIDWDSICRPKKCGGLGLRKTRDVNSAYMMRGRWRLCINKDPLWTSVVRKKYGYGSNILPKVDKTRSGSNCWRGLYSVWDPFIHNISWRTGNGKVVNFWQDNWVSNTGPVVNHVTNSSRLTDTSKTVHDFVRGNGWMPELFSSYIPQTITSKIRAMVPPFRNSIDDCFSWKHAKDGVFTLATTYEVISTQVQHDRKKLFLVI